MRGGGKQIHAAVHGLVDEEGFLLRNTPGLVGWWRKTKINSSGGLITSWSDETGNYPLSQTTEARRPAYSADGWNGGPCAIFEASTEGRILRNNAIATDIMAGNDTPFSILCVLSGIGTRAASRCLWQSYLAGTTYMQAFNTSASPYKMSMRRYVNPETVNVTPAAADAGWYPGDGVKHGVFVEFNGTTVRILMIYADITLDSGSIAMDTASFGGNQFTIGSNIAASTTLQYPMKLVEVSLFNRVLPAATLTNLANLTRATHGLDNKP